MTTVFEVTDFCSSKHPETFLFITKASARSKTASVLLSYRNELRKYNESVCLEKYSDGTYYDCGMETVDIVSLKEREVLN